MLSEGVRGEVLAQSLDVDIVLELESDLAEPAEIELEFRVPVEGPGRLNRRGLDLGVGQRREVLLFSGDALDVDRDEPLVGEDHVVPGPLKSGDDLLASDQKLSYVFGECGWIRLLEFENGWIREADPEPRLRRAHLPKLVVPEAGRAVSPAP